MKILNFGSLNLDKVYKVAHFVREGETISAQEQNQFLGGKGLNQSVALARAGIFVEHAGAVGRETTEFHALLKAEGAGTTYLRVLETVSGHAEMCIRDRFLPSARFEGKRATSDMIADVCEVVAQIRGDVTPQEVALAARENARRMFGI